MKDIKHIRKQLNNIDFSHAEIEGVELKKGEVLIKVQDIVSRRRGPIRRLHCLRFTGVVYFKSFEFGAGFEIEVSENTKEIEEAWRVIEQDGGAAAGYPGLVQVSFVSSAPVMIVVFQELEAEIQENPR